MRFRGAEVGIQRFFESYRPELAALDRLRKSEPGQFYDELISYHGKDQPLKHQRYLLRIAAVMENQKSMNSAQAELLQVDELGLLKYTHPRPQGWEEFSIDMRASWGRMAASLKKESARAALAESEYMAARLRQTFRQVELLSLDISTSAARNFNLQSALNFSVRKPASVERDKERLHWPFENEIWEDELDYLKMKNPSKCAATRA
jgi:hypothetical protein